MRRVKVWTDGGCEPVNPGGVGSWGVVISPPNKEPSSYWGIVGRGKGINNSVSEFTALQQALRILRRLNLNDKEIVFYSDSQMLIKSMNGQYTPSSTSLYCSIHKEISAVVDAYFYRAKLDFVWVPREDNIADPLAVKALAEIGIFRKGY